MKNFIIIIMIFSLPILSITAQKESSIVDREIFFGNPEISSGQLSPDGTYVSFMREYNGIMNVWVKKFDADFSEAKLLTASSSPILGYMWTEDAKYILYVNDDGGDENFNIFAVDPGSEASPDKKAPESRNLTPLKEVSVRMYSASKKDPDMMMIGLNDRDKAWHDLYKLKISTGELSKVFENNNRYTGYFFDWDENLRMASRTDEDGNSQILRVDEDGTFEEVYSNNISESAGIVNWTKDNKECYLVSNKGDVNLTSLYTLNPETGKVTFVESDPKEKVDFGNLWMNDNTREIISTSYVDDKNTRYFKDKKWEGIYNYLKKQFKDREVGFKSFTKDYSKILISVSGDKYATEVYFFDPESKDLILQYTPRPKLKKVEDHLSPMQPISYKSSDGLEIPGYLSLPAGKNAKNLPTVILVHGGPKGPRDYWGYDSDVQFLNNRGYAVLQPNFRASGGYGQAFMNAGDKQWGKLMQDDITWGVKYLIDQGIADPDKIAIMGGSYGGYATLAGLAFTPELYACGIDIVGPSNLFTLLESIPPYWEAGRKWLYQMVGDPETEEGQKLLKEASPLFSVDNISKPLLIVQGANDPRVKKAEADQIVIALRDKGHPVDYLLAEDEGHGFRKPLNRKAMYAQVEKFLSVHLGGSYQKDIPDDVAKTLEALTIDVSTVVLEEKVEMQVLTALPATSYEWQEGTTEYDVLIEMQGQKMPMTMTRTVSKSDAGWTVNDVSVGAMGQSKDMVVFNDQMKSISRNLEQGGQQMQFEYGEKMIKLNAMGKDIEIPIEGLAIADGPGFDYLLAGLEMKEGEEHSFFLADMMTMKAKQVVAKCTGQEDLDGKSCDVILVNNIENEKDQTKFWIDSNSKEAVKIEQIMPAMGNAKMTITKK